MKGQKSGQRPSRLLSYSLNRRLASYAAAATAAGAGVFGSAQPAEAHIVYTPAQATIGLQTGYALDLTNTGTTDFIIHGTLSFGCSTVFSQLLIKPALDNAVEGRSYLGLIGAKEVGGGQRIGSSEHFTSRGRNGVLMGEAVSSPGLGQYIGAWIHVVNRYLGLRFQINGETHFGWARMTVNLSLHRPMHALLTGYAYETEPNVPITAGQEQSEEDATPVEPRIKGEPGSGASLMVPKAPEPASLGILALGASGMPVWRRQTVHLGA